jgi:hypothetical protein
MTKSATIEVIGNCKTNTTQNEVACRGLRQGLPDTARSVLEKIP